MGRVKVDEKGVVGEIVGLGKYDPEILVPIYQKLSGTALNVHVAFYRIILGLELLEQWENYINGSNANPNATLRGGGSSA